MATSTRSAMVGACLTVIVFCGIADGAPKGGPLTALEERVAALEALVDSLQQALAGANGSIDTLQGALEAEQTARAAAEQALQAAIAAEALARVATDQALQSGIAAEVAARVTGDGALQSAINAEAATRAAADLSLNAAVASITTTETFSSRVPVGLNNVSLGTAPQIEYTDVASFGQNTDASVFAMASDGTLTILKAGAVPFIAGVPLSAATIVTG